MTTIGYATLAVIPSLDGVSSSINKQLAGMPDVGSKLGKQIGDNLAAGALGSDVGKRIGKNLADGVGDGAKAGANEVQSRLSERLGAQVGMVIGRGVGAGLKGSMTAAAKIGEVALTTGLTGAAGVASVALGGVGLALSKGFERLQSIDAAQAKLRALGNDSATVSKIMDSALTSVKGTAFGLGDAATAAASAVAAGIQPGQDLTKYLGEIGDAAAVAGTNFEDMGSIFNKIQTQNKAYTDDLQQLSDRGLPIFTWLQKEYGVTGDKLSEMVQKGEVDSAHFQDAIDKNIGGAAQKMGQSFDGAVKNMGAALGRLGADLLEPLLGNQNGALGGIADVITKVQGSFDTLDNWIKAHPSDITQYFAKIGDAVITAGQILGNTGEIALNTIGYLKTISDWTGIGSVIDLGFDPHKAADDLGALTDKLGPLKDKMDGTAKSSGDAAQFLADMHGAVLQLSGDTITLKDNTPEVLANLDKTKFAVTTMPDGTVKLVPLTKQATDEMNAWRESQNKTPIAPPVDLNTGPATEKLNALYSQYQKLFNAPPNVPPPSNAKSPQDLLLPPGHALGGLISGAGSGVSDSILAMVSNGEYVVNAAATKRNLALLEVINNSSGKISRFATGGQVGGAVGGPDADTLKKYASQIQGGTYVRGGPAGPSGTDCSGAQAWMANFITGGSGRFATGTEREALLSRGFTLGDPPPGIPAYWVGWKNGGPGGGHTAGTIVDPTGGNVNVEMGGSAGGGSYGGGAGASGFAQRAWIALAGKVAAQSADGLDAEDPNAPTTLGDASASGSITGGIGAVPSSLSGLSSWGLDSLGVGVGKTGSGSDLSVFGKAAGSAVSGQIASALGVFGATDSPGWLKGISTAVGGIKASKKDGTPIFDGSNPFGSFTPLSATPTYSGAPPDGSPASGKGLGAEPGPQNVANFTIYARDSEDAIDKWKREMNQRSAAKLSRY